MKQQITRQWLHVINNKNENDFYFKLILCAGCLWNIFKIFTVESNIKHIMPTRLEIFVIVLKN